ncbi:DegT/DnrJ/EryC1/StrS family aminotransferase [candidate division WOR-3 bacterium]|nr:DegT/DnrJ/EryC1/StrS family aminotransferase [candidate division WOR-3 bacterium]
MNVPLLDLKAQFESIRAEVEAAIAGVLETQRFILGPVVKACEEAVAEYCGCAHAVGVSSGTDALLVALMADGIGPGDEVVTTAYSFFATAGCIARLGAKPVFVDINPETCNIDPAGIEERITPRTRVILPVHLYGRMADMDPVMEVAERHGLAVIEDAAQAIGAEDRGRRAGSIGDYGCFSFFPSKNLGAFGDGGMVVTNDPDRAERLRVLRAHGSSPKYYHKVVGGNFRLDALQAAVVLAKLPHLDSWTTRRQANARRYDRLFRDTGLVRDGLLVLPDAGDAPGVRHVYNQYVIRTPRREALRAFLRERAVGCEVYYPLPLHLQECFAGLGYRADDLPGSERAANETLALPVYPELTDEQATYVVACVGEFHSRRVP